ncbi:MAG TPA: hypothetical protein VFW44_17310 [Bryobacteraceae bacterium]|nr:hypothetical protein [Bryobacteraceae bacterium]
MPIKPENRFWIYIYGFTAFIFLIAMGVFGWLAWTSRQEPGTGRVAGPVPVAAAAPAAALADEDYDRLATFEAPKYTPEPHASKSFQEAIGLYRNQKYRDAAGQLRAIVQAQPNFTAAKFYLGLSLLLSDNRIAGIEELRDLTEAEDSPYTERARFYLAKALIGEHDLRRAQHELEGVISQHGPREKEAATLLSEIRSPKS